MYRLPDELRPQMRRPLGPVLDGKAAVDAVRDAPRITTVGDVVTATMLDADVIPQIMIVDGKTKRTDAVDAPTADDIPGASEVQVTNEAATISDELWDAIATAYASHARTLIRVDGEEDLAALPSITHAPEGTRVLYGQPDEGAVVVTVDQTTRRRVMELLAQMEVV